MNVPSFMPDTSCMVAAVSSWHEHHGRALAAIDDRLGRKQRMIVAAPALIETYSVLTRLPAPHRMLPADGLAIVEANFLGVQAVVLTAAGYRTLLRESGEAAISGGRIYDSVITACARKAKVSILLTFNDEDFRPFAGPDLDIVVP